MDSCWALPSSGTVTGLPVRAVCVNSGRAALQTSTDGCVQSVLTTHSPPIPTHSRFTLLSRKPDYTINGSSSRCPSSRRHGPMVAVLWPARAHPAHGMDTLTAVLWSTPDHPAYGTDAGGLSCATTGPVRMGQTLGGNTGPIPRTGQTLGGNTGPIPRTGRTLGASPVPIQHP